MLAASSAGERRRQHLGARAADAGLRRRRPAPGADPHRPRDRRAQPRRRRRRARRPLHPGRRAGPAARRPRSRRSRGSRRRSARSTSRSTATTSGCGRSPRSVPPRCPTSAARSSCSSTTCSSPAARCAPRSTRCSSSGGRAPCSSRCSSTAVTASCRSAPTTWARTCRPGRPRTCGCGSGRGRRRRRRGRDLGRPVNEHRTSAPMKHLLSVDDLGGRAGIEAMLDLTDIVPRGDPARHPEGAGAAGQDRRLPLLRGLDPHPALVRDRGQAALGRHDDLQRRRRRR